MSSPASDDPLFPEPGSSSRPRSGSWGDALPLLAVFFLLKMVATFSEVAVLSMTISYDLGGNVPDPTSVLRFVLALSLTASFLVVRAVTSRLPPMERGTRVASKVLWAELIVLGSLGVQLVLSDSYSLQFWVRVFMGFVLVSWVFVLSPLSWLLVVWKVQIRRLRRLLLLTSGFYPVMVLVFTVVVSNYGGSLIYGLGIYFYLDSLLQTAMMVTMGWGLVAAFATYTFLTAFHRGGGSQPGAAQRAGVLFTSLQALSVFALLFLAVLMRSWEFVPFAGFLTSFSRTTLQALAGVLAAVLLLQVVSCALLLRHLRGLTRLLLAVLTTGDIVTLVLFLHLVSSYPLDSPLPYAPLVLLISSFHVPSVLSWLVLSRGDLPLLRRLSSGFVLLGLIQLLMLYTLVTTPFGDPSHEMVISNGLTSVLTVQLGGYLSVVLSSRSI